MTAERRRFGPRFSVARFGAIAMKEFVQMRRDRLTFAMMVGIPIMQLILFGYAINTDPRHLPTLVELGDTGPASRAIVQAMETSRYFDIEGVVFGAADINTALKTGEAMFVVTIPANFERDLARGERPQILLDVDATDPVAASAAASSFPRIVESAVAPLLDGALSDLAQGPPPVEVVLHRRYNASGRSALNIVPGLLGTILTLTMVLMTAIALTREAERGTLESLLATPAQPLEVMAGKISPFVLVGVLQTAIMLGLARTLFGVPFLGAPPAFLALITMFVVVNLSIGFLFSTLAKSQMQAMQMTFFFFLPSILLSGFMFPFRGMPGWAQNLGEALPLTHFVRGVRAVMLKGAGLGDTWAQIWPLAIILAVVATLALSRYRRTLD